jgi:hypothetical protein
MDWKLLEYSPAFETEILMISKLKKNVDKERND